MTSIHVTNHSGPYRTIQDHTEPYQTTEGHIRGNKCVQSQKELCICHSLTDSGYFTHIELPTQLKKEKILEIVFVKHIMIMK